MLSFVITYNITSKIHAFIGRGIIYLYIFLKYWTFTVSHKVWTICLYKCLAPLNKLHLLRPFQGSVTPNPELSVPDTVCHPLGLISLRTHCALLLPDYLTKCYLDSHVMSTSKQIGNALWCPSCSRWPCMDSTLIKPDMVRLRLIRVCKPSSKNNPISMY